MRAAAKSLLLVVVFCASANRTLAQSADTAVIDKYISGQESYKNGYQSEGYTTVLSGDLNHDGVADAAVLYTLEGQNGTNNYVQYLAVLVRVKGRLVPVARTVAGGKNYRAIKIKAIKDNMIWCDTTGYAPNDPSCCPTIKGSTRYALEGKKLKELGTGGILSPASPKRE